MSKPSPAFPGLPERYRHRTLQRHYVESGQLLSEDFSECNLDQIRSDNLFTEIAYRDSV
jgi:hypothetical protein